jgi:hypothetical protein
MADKNIQMTQRNIGNTAWDNLYPITKADNIIGFQNSLLSIGWRKLPDGTIEQWGYVDFTGLVANVWATKGITFPIAFPSQCFELVTDIYASSGSYGQSNNGYYTKTGFTAYIKPETAGAATLIWRAIGA